MVKPAKITQYNKFAKYFAISQERREGWGWFFVQVNMTVSYKVILSFFMVAARHAWSTQNNKYAVTLQYLKKKLTDEVGVLHTYW